MFTIKPITINNIGEGTSPDDIDGIQVLVDNTNWDYAKSSLAIHDLYNWIQNYKNEFMNIMGGSLDNFNFIWKNNFGTERLIEDGNWHTYFDLQSVDINIGQPTITFKQSTNNIIAKPILLTNDEYHALKNHDPTSNLWLGNHLVLNDEKGSPISFKPTDINNAVFGGSGTSPNHQLITFNLNGISDPLSVWYEIVNFNDLFKLNLDTTNSYGVKDKNGIYNHYTEDNLPSLKLEFNQDKLNALMMEKDEEAIRQKIDDALQNTPTFTEDTEAIKDLTQLIPSIQFPTRMLNYDIFGVINKSNVDDFISTYLKEGRMANWFHKADWGQGGWSNEYHQPNFVGYYNDMNQIDDKTKQWAYTDNLDQFSLSALQNLFNQPNAHLSFDIENGKNNIKESIGLNGILDPKPSNANDNDGLTWDKSNLNLNINIPQSWYANMEKSKGLSNIKISNFSVSTIPTNKLNAKANNTTPINMSLEEKNVAFDFDSNLAKNNILINNTDKVQDKQEQPAWYQNEAGRSAQWEINANKIIQNSSDLNPTTHIPLTNSTWKIALIATGSTIATLCLGGLGIYAYTYLNHGKYTSIKTPSMKDPNLVKIKDKKSKKKDKK